MGPYNVSPGTRALAETPFERHIASLDVPVDDGKRRILMYHHGAGYQVPKELTEATCLAVPMTGGSVNRCVRG